MKRLLVLFVLYGILAVMVRPCFVVALVVSSPNLLSFLLIRFQLPLLVAFRWSGSCFLLEFAPNFCLLLLVVIMAGSIGLRVGIESIFENVSYCLILLYLAAEFIAKSGSKP